MDYITFNQKLRNHCVILDKSDKKRTAIDTDLTQTRHACRPPHPDTRTRTLCSLF